MCDLRDKLETPDGIFALMYLMIKLTWPNEKGKTLEVLVNKKLPQFLYVVTLKAKTFSDQICLVFRFLFFF